MPLILLLLLLLVLLLLSVTRVRASALENAQSHPCVAHVADANIARMHALLSAFACMMLLSALTHTHSMNDFYFGHDHHKIRASPHHILLHTMYKSHPTAPAYIHTYINH